MSSLFNQAQLSTRQDVIAGTTHTQDNARIQQFNFGQSELMNDPSRRSLHWALNNNAATYSSTVGGVGLNPHIVDLENKLLRTPTFDQQQAPARSHVNRNVNPRLVLTTPYLGKGSVDPALEFRLAVGVARPLPKRRTNLPDSTAANYDYESFARDHMMTQAAQPPQPDAFIGDSLYSGPTPSLLGFQPRQTFEEQTHGMSIFGENTRLAKYA